MEVANATVKAYVNIICHAWRVAKREWGINLPLENPCDMVTMPKVNDARDRIPSKSEYAKLLDACNSSNLFILNESYLDAIANYEKIYDIQSLIFGINHKNVANTLIVLGDLYYKLDDEVNALRCFQESIRIIHYNYMISNQTFITPLEYLFEIYLNNDQTELAGEISDKLSNLYSLDTLSYDMVIWSQILSDKNYYKTDTLGAINDSSIIFINPQNYLDSAIFYINSEEYKMIKKMQNCKVQYLDGSFGTCNPYNSYRNPNLR